MLREGNEVEESLNNSDERASAFHQTIVFMRQNYPNMAVMTYDNEQLTPPGHIILSKIIVGTGEDNPEWLTYNSCSEETTADNIPGGLEGTAYIKDGQKITTAIYPLMFGRDNTEWEGAALVKIKNSGEGKIWVKAGTGEMSFMHYSPNKDMKGQDLDCRDTAVQKEDETLIISKEKRSLISAVSGNFNFEIKEKTFENGETGEYFEGCCNEKEAYLIFAFSKNKERAKEISLSDPGKEKEKIKEYYDKCLENWEIKTPSKTLNEAFKHAFLNVEYSWLRPYGWIESIHHWATMWHMEHTAAEEWAGNFDRVRECLRSLMKNVFENGAIPDMSPNGGGRRDWGGNDHFFLREVDHYLKMTKDKEFAIEAEPFMERALEHAFDEYDPADGGVLAWGTQIGNQEDFESTPGKGAATGSEGVRMLEIMADLKRFLGKEKEAIEYEARSKHCFNKLMESIWLKDLGRFAWYEDINGEKKLETTYHGICYPVIYDQIDDFSKMSSLDHLKNRLTGPEGEVYQTNHFGNHAYDWVPTWGMQCGSNMQAFATMAYSEAGMRNDAVRPLEFIAERVCSDFQRGTWPETANERRFAYFSPSAAVFSQAMIEGVFGLKNNLIKDITTISPCFPDKWDNAKIKLNNVSMEYKKELDGFLYIFKSDLKTKKVFDFKLPVSRKHKVFVNGVEKECNPEQTWGMTKLKINCGRGNEIRLKISYEEINFETKFPGFAAQGEFIETKINNKSTSVKKIYDPCNVMDEYEICNNKIKCLLRSDLLKEYSKFGKFGLVNFSRRTFGVVAEYKGDNYYIPFNISVLPDFITLGEYNDEKIKVMYQNNSNRNARGRAVLDLCGKKFIAEDILIEKTSRGEFTINKSGLNENKISHGDNLGKITIMSENGETFYSGDIVIEGKGIKTKLKEIALDENLVKPKDYWREIGLHPEHGHMMQGPDLFMKDLFEKDKYVEVDENLKFRINPKGFIPFSTKKHRHVTLSLEGVRAKKLYLLVSAFIDNHDVFSKIFTIETETQKKDSFIRPVFRKDVFFPGDLHMGFGHDVIAGFTTYDKNQENVLFLDMPYETKTNDYMDSRPPYFPQKYLWCNNKSHTICETVFNVIEIDLKEEKDFKELRIISKEADASGGIFAILAH